MNFRLDPLAARMPAPCLMPWEPAWTPAQWAEWEAAHPVPADAAQLRPGPLVQPVPAVDPALAGRDPDFTWLEPTTRVLPIVCVQEATP